MLTVDDLMRMKDKPVIAADQDGFITYVNEAFEATFGWTAAEAVGQPLTMIIPQNLRHAHHLGFSRFQTTGHATVTGRPISLRAIDKAGREFDAEHFIVGDRRDGRWRFAATVQPKA